MAAVYLDTHVLLWLHSGAVNQIPAAAKKLIENSDTLVSPMVALEVEFLFELGRFTKTAETLIAQLGREIGLRVCDLPFPLVANYAAKVSWTCDPFDRLIVGQAMAAEKPLLTKDRLIRENYPSAVWD